MQANNFSLSQYLERIGFEGQARADLATVTAMMRCQLFTVPFENLDVQAGKVVSLVPEEIVEKIILRQRGGYCYEVNALFAMALQELGIPYQMVAARPMFYPVRRPRTHMALIVEVEGAQWLCDLGFGSYGIRQPMRLDLLDVEVSQDSDTFKLSMPNVREYLLQAKADGVWANQYGFDLSVHEWIDFVPANYLNSTHPDAIFVQKLLVVLHQPWGRYILLDHNLKTVRDGVSSTQVIEPGQRAQVLHDLFKLQQN